MINALIISNILLWIAVLALGVLVFALTRQIGVLYERVAPAGALMMNKKLAPGEAAPELEVVDIDGNLLSIGGKSKTGRSQLLFFISPTCPVCKTLLPVVKSASRSEDDWLEVILASDGEDAAHREYIKKYELTAYPYVSSEALGMQYGVSKLPYAVLIDEAGTLVTMGIINSREHLESLFESRELGVPSIQAYLEKHSAQETNANELV